jgi:hypothetical protein
MVTLYSAIRVYLKVLQTITLSLFRAEPDLVIASLALGLASSIHLLKGDLFLIRSPSMRKYGVRRDLILKKLSQAEVAIAFPLQKTHIDAEILKVVKARRLLDDREHDSLYWRKGIKLQIPGIQMLKMQSWNWRVRKWSQKYSTRTKLVIEAIHIAAEQ